jgi:hypothetical protein
MMTPAFQFASRPGIGMLTANKAVSDFTLG